MTTPLATHHRNPSPTARFVAALALGLGVLLGPALPAEARDEFASGFEYEFGRIVAHGVTALGHSMLAPAVVIHREFHHHEPRHAARRNLRRWHIREHHRRSWHDRASHGRTHHHHRHYGRTWHHRGHRHDHNCSHGPARTRRNATHEHDRRERGPQRGGHGHRSRYAY